MSPIWFQTVTLEDLNRRGQDSMSDFLGIVFTEIGDDYMIATMPASPKTKQPLGIVHGGASVVLAETIASTAANVAVDFEHYYCVGLEINANHLRSVKDGLVTAVTHPVHLGRTTQVWNVEITNDAGQKTCISRMTACVLTRK
ncbi:MAG: hotdog fold thioesterase [Gammaproteobacteria bacterium]|nr:hotdog fold thioesterase [Gammaproteobacteria bacterium]